MLRRYLLLVVICLPLVSCNLIRGNDFLDTDLTSDSPIAVDGLAAGKLAKKARWYRVYWGAVTVADLYIILLPTREGYGIRTVIRSRGIAKMLSRWQSDAGATMTFETPDKYRPVRYKTAFQLRNKKRRIDIRWDKNGNITKESNEPPENRNKRPAVSAEGKKGAYDPLTAIMVARDKIRKAILAGKKKFTVPMYDGRRRTDMNFTIHGANDKGQIHVSFTEGSIEGYTNSELKDLKERDAYFHLYLDPKDLFPVFGKGQSLIGKAYIRLKKECSTLRECIAESE
jgi:hypothetical protein